MSDSAISFENGFEVLQIVSRQQQVQFLKDADEYFKDHPDALAGVLSGTIDPDALVDSIPDETLDKYFLSSTLLNLLKSTIATTLGLGGIDTLGLDTDDND